MERFRLFLHGVLSHQTEPLHRSASLVSGMAFILPRVLLAACPAPGVSGFEWAILAGRWASSRA